MVWHRLALLFVALLPAFAGAKISSAGAELKHQLESFRPNLNFDNLGRVSWRIGEAKLAIRNDWIENFLNLALNDAIRNHSDLKDGSGEVHIVRQSPGDSIITLRVHFDVVPKNVWFDPHVRCDGELRLSFPQTPLAQAQIRVLDREPIQDCEVNGTVGKGLDLGRYVRAKLNDKIANLPEQNFLYKIGDALFGDGDIKDRMTRMYLLQELVPYATLGMDDCAADAELNLPTGNSVCLRLLWPADRFDAALTKIIAALPASQPATGLIPESRIQQWRDISPVCGSRGVNYPSKGGCETGDMNLFAGLLCLSGEQIGCQMVRDSQDADGRWWRSPQHVGQANDDFSADMFMGTIAYLNQTHDTARYANWLHFISGQQKFFPVQAAPRLGLFQSCPNSSGGVCNLMGAEWNWLRQLTDRSTSGRGVLPDYGYDTSWILVESLANERGFRLHLVAVSVLLHEIYGNRNDPNIQLAAKVLAAREPQNPFFVYLALGRDQRVLQLMSDQCPAPGVRPAEQNQWSWERSIEEKAYTHSMGWDCVFMARLWNRGLQD